MKTILLASAFLAIGATALAKDSNKSSSPNLTRAEANVTEVSTQFTNIKMNKMDTSKPLDQLIQEYNNKQSIQGLSKGIKLGEVNPLGGSSKFLQQLQELQNDSQDKLQSLKGMRELSNFPIRGTAPAVLQSFDGYSNEDNLSLFGGRVTPPDTNGDVGKDYYVQYVNLGWVFARKDGSEVLGPFAGNVFWQGFGGICEDRNAGDPIVLYDQIAEQWIFSQFTGAEGDGHQCFAVSQGSDPAGPYYRYDFTVSEGTFNDYPKITVWPNGYYMTTHEFGNFFPSFRVTVFNRKAMLAGEPANFFQFNNSTGGGRPGLGALTAHLEGNDLPPNENACNPIIRANDGSNRYDRWQVCVDFDNPRLNRYERLDSISVPAWRAAGSIAQPEGANLDSLSQFTMYRYSSRYFPETNRLQAVATHSVRASSSSGVQWVSLDINLDTGAAQISEDGRARGLIDFNDGLSRWMPSAAIDKKGNIGFGYTVASPSQFPSIRYTVHEVGVDVPNGVQAEQSCVEGTGSILPVDSGDRGANRWGDYSSMSVDPNDQCTFWHTNEYVEVTGPRNWTTRICSFKIPGCDELQPPQAPKADFDSDCDGLNCRFDASASSDDDGRIVDYAWRFSDGASASGTVAVKAFPEAGEYTVTLVVTDDSGLTGTLSKTVTVEADQGPPLFETNLSGSSRGDTQTFELNVPLGSSAVTFTLSGNNGDADLYVGFNSPPSFGRNGRYVCREISSGSNESCTLNNPRPGTYFVTVRTWNPFTGATLVGEIQ